MWRERKHRDTGWCLLKERVSQVNSPGFQTWLYEYKEATVFSENKSRHIIKTYKKLLYKNVINEVKNTEECCLNTETSSSARF